MPRHLHMGIQASQIYIYMQQQLYVEGMLSMLSNSGIQINGHTKSGHIPQEGVQPLDVVPLQALAVHHDPIAGLV